MLLNAAMRNPERFPETAELLIQMRELEKELRANFPERYLLDESGNPIPFHAAQNYAWDSNRRIIAMIAGTQSGKTSFGPWWLWREIKRRGKGDYLAVTSSYDLFKLKMLPEFLRVFEGTLELGRFWAGGQVFELKDPETGEYLARRFTDPMWGRVILRSANAVGGLEAATVKGLWLDEAGQDNFEVDAWRASRRRGAIHEARILITTTLYNLGWLKLQIIDRANDKGVTRIESELRGGAEIRVTDNAEAGICLIQYDSILNPAYPLTEFEEARATMPEDEFAMFYRGLVAKLRDLIFDSFDHKRHTQKRFEIPTTWRRVMGLDFGGVNTCAVKYAQDPDTKIWIAYAEYLAGGRTAKEHVEELLRSEPPILDAEGKPTKRIRKPITFGGSKSEGQWRQEFSAAGLRVHEPEFSDVELGIGRVYGLHKKNQVSYFDDLEGILDQKGRYRRKRDRKTGEVLEEIENKEMFHYLDAERYIGIGMLSRTAAKMGVISLNQADNASETETGETGEKGQG